MGDVDNVFDETDQVAVDFGGADDVVEGGARPVEALRSDRAE
jgi:hypothetical protein